MANKKVKLGGKPKNFKKSVEIVLLDGAPADIEISFIYRTRKEYAALLDEKIAAAKADAAALKDAADLEAEAGTAVAAARSAPAKTVAELFDEVDTAGAQFVLKIANGWDLDDPFNEASLLQLEDENPGALQAITVAYAQTVAEARAKNS